MQDRENIVISDIHGCRDELNQLLAKLNYNKVNHRVILVGDVLDRGPDPIGLIHQIQDMQLEMVFANHEEKCLRWRRYEALKELTGQENPMKSPTGERKKEWLALSKADLQWLTSLPLQIHIKNNWYAVHAGLEPGTPFDKQDAERMIRIRYADKSGLFTKAKPSKDNDSQFWAEMWSQPYNIVFGHHRFDEPTVFKNTNNTCIGIDTGCVYGGSLTAYNVDTNEFIQIKSKKTYYKR